MPKSNLLKKLIKYTDHFENFKEQAETLFGKSWSALQKDNAFREEIVNFKTEYKDGFAHCFAQHNQVAGIEWLKKLGCDFNRINQLGDDVVDVALKYGALEVFNFINKDPKKNFYTDNQSDLDLFNKGELLRVIATYPANEDGEPLLSKIKAILKNEDFPVGYGVVAFMFAILLGTQNLTVGRQKVISFFWEKLNEDIDDEGTALGDGFSFTERAIHVALTRGNDSFEVAAFLIKTFFSVEEDDFLEAMLYLKSRDKTKRLREFLDSEHCRAFQESATRLYPDRATELWPTAFADVQQPSLGSRLHALIEKGNVEAFETAIADLKAEPEKLKAELAYRKHGLTVAQHAVKCNNREILRTLQLAGYDFPDLTDTRLNILGYAIDIGSMVARFIYEVIYYPTNSNNKNLNNNLLQAVYGNETNKVALLLNDNQLETKDKLLGFKFAVLCEANKAMLELYWNTLTEYLNKQNAVVNIEFIFTVLRIALTHKYFQVLSNLITLFAPRVEKNIQEKEVVSSLLLLTGTVSAALWNEFLTTEEAYVAREKLIQSGYLAVLRFLLPASIIKFLPVDEQLAKRVEPLGFYSRFTLQLCNGIDGNYPRLIADIKQQTVENLIVTSPEGAATLLHHCASLGLTPLMGALLERAPQLLDAKTTDKLTALDVTCHNQHYRAALFLLEKGANFKDELQKEKLIADVFKTRDRDLVAELVRVFKTRNLNADLLRHILVSPDRGAYVIAESYFQELIATAKVEDLEKADEDGKTILDRLASSNNQYQLKYALVCLMHGTRFTDDKKTAKQWLSAREKENQFIKNVVATGNGGLMMDVMFSIKVLELNMFEFLLQVAALPSDSDALKQVCAYLSWPEEYWIKLLDSRFCFSQKDFEANQKALLGLLRKYLETDDHKTTRQELYKLACCEDFEAYKRLMKAFGKAAPASATKHLSVTTQAPKKPSKTKNQKPVAPSITELLTQLADSADQASCQENWKKCVAAFNSAKLDSLDKVADDLWPRVLTTLQNFGPSGVTGFVKLCEAKSPQLCGKIFIHLLQPLVLPQSKSYLYAFASAVSSQHCTRVFKTPEINGWKSIHFLALYGDADCVPTLLLIIKKVPSIIKCKTPDKKSVEELAAQQCDAVRVALNLKPHNHVEALPVIHHPPLLKQPPQAEQTIASKLIAAQLKYSQNPIPENLAGVIKYLKDLKNHYPDLARVIDFSIAAYQNGGLKTVEEIHGDRTIQLNDREESFLLLIHPAIASRDFVINQDFENAGYAFEGMASQLQLLGGDFAKQTEQCLQAMRQQASPPALRV